MLMKNIKGRLLLITSLVLMLLLQGCATQLPTFAHVHVGHALSAWTNTPNRIGLFILTENIANDITKLAVEADSQSNSGDMQTARNTIIKILPLIGSTNDEVAEPDDYTFLSAYKGAIDHLSYAMASTDASVNLRNGLEELIQKKDIIIVRTEVIKELLNAVNQSANAGSQSELIKEIRKLSVQNFEGDLNEYGLKQMRNEFYDILSRENPPYTVPEKKYLFGVIRLPDGTWFWQFKNADSGGGSYDQYSY